MAEINNKKQAGFERENYVEQKSSNKILFWSVIIGMIVILYFSYIVSTNVLLKNNHYISSNEGLMLFTPNEIRQVIIGLWYRDPILKTEILMYYLAPFAVLLLITALLLRAAQSALKSSTPTGNRHGSASFDSEEEIFASGLVVKNIQEMIEKGESGVSLGMAEIGTGKNKKRIYLIEKSQNEHILCYAPSRSGKGVGLVIPSLLMWNDSSITLDPKGENWDLTSGFLTKKGFNCIRLDLGAPYFRYNPLSEIDPRSIDLPDEVRRMIGVICGEGVKGDNKFFDDQARDLLTGCITYLIITYNDPIPGSQAESIINLTKKNKPNITLYDVAVYLSGIDPRTGKSYDPPEDNPEGSPFVTQYQEMANYLSDYVHHYETQKESYQVVGEFIETTGAKFLKQAATAEKTFQSIVSSADQNLGIFKLPIIRAVTDVSDFKLRQLVDPLHPPTALYIVNPPKDELTGKTDGVIKIILQNLFVSVLYETGLRIAYKEDIFTPHLISIISDVRKWNELKLKLDNQPAHDYDDDLIYQKREIEERCDPTSFLPIEIMILDKLKETESLLEYKNVLNILISKQVLRLNEEHCKLIEKLINQNDFKAITSVKYGWTKRSVLCMLDEFPKLGKFEIMEKLLADAAGYGAKFYLIAQSDKQINKAYEKENSIFAGCQHKVIYRPADKDTAKDISEILGNYTYIERTINVKDGDTGKIDILKSKSADKSWNESSRALMSQDEILGMKDDEAIILSKSHKIFGRKLRYFTDPYLSIQAKIKAPRLKEKPITTDDETFKKRMASKNINLDERLAEIKKIRENQVKKNNSDKNDSNDSNVNIPLTTKPEFFE